MGYAAGYRSGYLGGYLTEAAPPVERVVSQEGNPRIKLELAFESFGQPLTWYDESDYLRGTSPGLSIDRGRSAELDEFNTGTATVHLDNRTGRFDPANIAGPYYGMLKPRRQARISALVGTGTVPFTMKRSWVGGDDTLRGTQEARPLVLIRGDTGSFDRAWPGKGKDATVTLEIFDHSQRLNVEIPDDRDPVTNESVPIVVSGTTGDAMVQLLGVLGWPGISGDTAPIRNEFVDIDQGTVTLANYVSVPAVGHPVEGDYLGAIRKLALTEGGEVFFSREGRFTFRAAGVSGAMGGTWGDDTAVELPYGDVALRPADEVFINQVTIVEANGGTTTTSDPQSIADYGPASRSWDVFAIQGSQALLATQLLQRYAQPRERIQGFAPLGRRDVALWRNILPRDFGDRVGFVIRPVYGTVVQETLRLEGISIDSPDGFEWNVRWSASQESVIGPNLLLDQQGDFETGSHFWNTPLPSSLVVTNANQSPIWRIGGAGVGLNFLEWTKAASTDVAYTECELPADVATDLPGKDFVAGGLFKGRPGVGSPTGRLSVQWLDGVGQPVTEDFSPTIATSNSFRWTGASLQTTAPAGAILCRVRFASDSTSQRVVMDGLYLRQA